MCYVWLRGGAYTRLTVQGYVVGSELVIKLTQTSFLFFSVFHSFFAFSTQDQGQRSPQIGNLWEVGVLWQGTRLVASSGQIPIGSPWKGGGEEGLMGVEWLKPPTSTRSIRMIVYTHSGLLGCCSCLDTGHFIIGAMFSFHLLLCNGRIFS